MTGRNRVGVVAAIAAVAVALLLPSPRGANRPAPAAGQATHGGPAAALASVWPDTRPVSFAAIQPDGQRYGPLLFLDAEASIGRLSADGGLSSALVLRTGTATRVLQPADEQAATDVIAETATAIGIYWIQVRSDSRGEARFTVWAANRDGSAPRVVTTDTGTVSVFNAEHDFQAIDGRLYWLAVRSVATRAMELRSVAIGGGPVTAQPIDDNVALSTWPWVTTIIIEPGRGADLTNLVSGERRHAVAGPDEQVTCNPTWCLVSTTTAADTATMRLRRTDGSDPHEIATGDLWPAVSDVVVADRFTVLAGVGLSSLAGTNVRLSLYDQRQRRLVQADPGAVDVGSRNGFLWWSNGAGESLTWHVLDLRTLP